MMRCIQAVRHDEDEIFPGVVDDGRVEEKLQDHSLNLYSFEKPSGCAKARDHSGN